MYVDFLTSIMAIASCVGYWSVFQKMGYCNLTEYLTKRTF